MKKLATEHSSVQWPLIRHADEIGWDFIPGVIETLSGPRYRLDFSNVEPDFLGRAQATYFGVG